MLQYIQLSAQRGNGTHHWLNIMYAAQNIGMTETILK